ncbi:MAG: ATP-binding protein [Chthoniobacteraceae bacterium]
MNTRSIRFRLIGLYAGLLALVMLLFGAYTRMRLDHFLRVVLQTTLEHRAEQIVRDILPEIPKRGEAYVGTEIEKRFAPAINDRFVRVTRRGGQVLYLSGVPNDGNFTPEEVPAPAGDAPQGFTREQRLPKGSTMLITTLPGSIGGQDYLVEVGTSLAASNAVLRRLLLTLAAGLPVLTGLAIFGGYFLMKRAMKPVRDIIVSAQDITLHHLSRRLPVADSGDEIAELSKVLNQMIARLDESFQHTSRFTADASHELRTPLTVIHCELEAILRDRPLDVDLREALGSLLDEVVRLVRIVEGLFALSKLDTGEARSERVRFDLAKLAETTAEQMCLLAEEKHIKLVCETREQTEVEGDHSRLKQVIVNLLDNAIKYTPEAGRISLTVREDNGCALLEVADNGPGVSEAALPHLFKRFYRADEAHSREVEGAGLGLSIVHSICTAHGGSVSIRNVAPTGCQVTVQLPKAK